jgi:hypothetical protein
VDERSCASPRPAAAGGRGPRASIAARYSLTREPESRGAARIVQAEAYQKDQRLHYLSQARFDEALRTLGRQEVPEREAVEPVRAEKDEEPTEGTRPAGKQKTLS